MANAYPKTIAAIDVGTFKVAVLIAQITAPKKIEVLGMATARNTGMSKGVISDMDRVVASIKEAVETAGEMAGFDINKAWISIPSNELKSFNETGTTNVVEGKVTAQVMARACEIAKAACSKPDYYCVNILPTGVEIDSRDWVTDPKDMIANQITSHYHLMMLPIVTMQNIENAMNRTGIEVDRTVISTLAIAEAALQPDEKEYGVCLIDIGGGSTNVTVYLENRVLLSHTIAMGGEHVTRDIASELQTSTVNAENLKLSYGCADRQRVKPEQMVKVVGLTGSKVIERSKLTDIIIARYADILEAVRDYLEDNGGMGLLQHGIVLAGSASKIEGLASLTEQILGVSVHMYGHPEGVVSENNMAQLCQSDYATAAGLLLFSQGDMQKHNIELDALSKDYTAWFTRFFVIPWRKLMDILKSVI